jgi:hypothetical protein
MKQTAFSRMTTDELVNTFVELGMAQDAAELRGQIAKYNRLFKDMMDVGRELKSRDGDQRRRLVSLYGHANLHVWVQAAMMTLAVAPIEARAQLEIMAQSGRLPYSADAGMCLWNLDRGVFKPT